MLQGNDIKAAVAALKLRMMVEKSSGACNDFLLFGCGDAAEGAAKGCVAPQSNLDKQQAMPLQHDQVDFAPVAAVVTADQLAALSLKVVTRRLLAVSADLLRVRKVPG